MCWSGRVGYTHPGSVPFRRAIAQALGDPISPTPLAEVQALLANIRINRMPYPGQSATMAAYTRN